MLRSWNLDLPDHVARKVEASSALISPGGVADRSLYRRMAGAGFTHLSCFPMLASFQDFEGPYGRFLLSGVLARLSADEAGAWHTACRDAEKAGILFTTQPYHCVVGHKPGG